MTNINLYQSDAMSYRLPTATSMYALLNLGGEAGEVLSVVAKGIRDGYESKDIYVAELAKELGDVLWMVAAVASDNGLKLSDICQMNLDKLESREVRAVISGSGDNR